MTRTKVSVIMSEYNTPMEYLHMSIKSILEQTFTDFEFIIVDDCGNNNLDKIAQEYNDDRIQIIKNDKNRGLIYSLNNAVRHAEGEYLVRMDTDDIAMPNRIEKLIQFITEHPEYDVIGSRVIEFSEEGDTGILGISGENTAKSIMRGQQLVHPSVIMKKSAVLKVGGYPNYKRAEDLALWCELLLNGARLFVIDDILLRYRVNLEDYNKRKLKYRSGEIKARLHYYPKFNASALDYTKISRLLISSVMPNKLVQQYRSTFRLKPPRAIRATLFEHAKNALRPLKIILTYYASPLKLNVQDKNKHKVIVALAADYGNLGDKAITNAQIQFLESIFAKSEIIVINASDTYKYLRNLKKILNPKDTITLLGGGNIGTIYPYIENQRRVIIKKFPRNQIVSFPQSIYFSTDKKSQKYLDQAIKIYSEHDQLHLFARDQQTYKFMKKHFTKNKVELVPDIVLSQQLDNPPTKRNANKVVLSLRTDAETVVNSTEVSNLIHALRNQGYSIVEKDTEVNILRMPRNEGRKRVHQHLKLYAGSGAVITDRLHGMIFCAITKTPCIAIDNSNGKVHEFYNTWLKNITYIKTTSSLDPDSISKILVDIKHTDYSDSTPVYFKDEFQTLRDALGHQQ